MRASPPGRALVLGVLGGAGVLAIVASAQPWWRARAEGTQVNFTGSEASGGLSQALAIVVLAGVLLCLTLRSRGRRVLSIFLGLGGVGMLALGVLRQRPSADAVRDRVRQVSLADQFDLAATAWPWIFGAAGLLALVAAALLFWAAPSWPGRRARFERAVTAVDLDEDPAAAWQALDAGLDPTAGPDAPGVDPDVHQPAPGDTMERKLGTQPPR